MEFYAPDPRWLSVSGKTESTTGSGITNSGNMISYPVVTYTQTGGAASAPVSLKIDVAVGKYVELDLGITLQDGDVLVIDCNPRNRADGILYTPSGMSTVNGLYLLGTGGINNTIGNDATFPYLNPGMHTIAFAGANSIVAAWNDAYAL